MFGTAGSVVFMFRRSSIEFLHRRKSVQCVTYILMDTYPSVEARKSMEVSGWRAREVGATPLATKDSEN